MFRIGTHRSCPPPLPSATPNPTCAPRAERQPPSTGTARPLLAPRGSGNRALHEALQPPSPSLSPRVPLPDATELEAILRFCGLPAERLEQSVELVRALWEAWASILYARAMDKTYLNTASELQSRREEAERLAAELSACKAQTLNPASEPQSRREEAERLAAELSACKAQTRVARQTCRRARRRLRQREQELARARATAEVRHARLAPATQTVQQRLDDLRVEQAALLGAPPDSDAVPSWALILTAHPGLQQRLRQHLPARRLGDLARMLAATDEPVSSETHAALVREVGLFFAAPGAMAAPEARSAGIGADHRRHARRSPQGRSRAT